MVYGHTGVDFPYYDAYTRLQYRDNPFMGPFAKDYFSSFGKSTDFTRRLTREYFFTVNQHWLEVYHVDGFRYDCVPNFWDGPTGVGYSALVYDTYQLTKARIAQSAPFWTRFVSRANSPIGLIQCAEQLEGPQEILRSTYSNATWQNTTFDAASPIGGCRSVCRATPNRKPPTARSSRRPRCNTSRITITNGSCATSG
jgi:1,4-alpha-glucan branching enzyme